MIDLNNLKKDCLVVDLETSAFYPDSGKEINLNSAYDHYVEHAEIKWIGCYSFKHNKYYSFTYKDADKAKQLIAEHNVLVGFNIEDFDYPILKNNGYVLPDTWKNIVDCMVILGKSVFKTRGGFKYKNRGELMEYKFKNNKLSTMAEEMKLETQKGDIDYKIFHKNEWTPEEEKEIKKYLKADIMATTQIFEKLWDYWKPFTDLLDEKSIRDLSWIRSSIASLTYKSACYFIGVEPTYSEKKSAKEEMGGNVYNPKLEEAKDVWYIDFASLYPHTFCCFNLFGESEPDDNNALIWHGNDLFKVKGYYNISKKHPLTEHVSELLKKRIELKKTDKKHPMVYTIKNFLNGLYGVVRSALFEKVHTANAGYDVCWLGQQIQNLTSEMMKEFGFETIGGDTDSLHIIALNQKHNNREYVQECLNKIMKKINENVPFIIPTFSIDIECKMDYALFPFSEQPIVEEDIRKKLKDEDVEGYIKDEIDGKKVIIDTNLNKIVKKGRSWVKEYCGRKKNYLYITTEDGEKEIHIVGLPIKKDNATTLSMTIFDEVLKPLILKNNKAKFSEEFIHNTIEEYLKKPGVLESLAREFKCKPYNTYKKPESQLQAQISKHYFYEQDGVIKLIKNDKIGVGKGAKYCSVQEAKEAKLTVKDLDLEKLNNELQPFIEIDLTN